MRSLPLPALSIPSFAALRAWAFEKVDELTFQLSICATLLTVVLYGPDAWYVRGVTLALAAGAWLLPRWAQHRNLWFALFALSSFYVMAEQHDADNHKYLLAYWCLAVFLAIRSSAPRRALALSGRMLIAACMLLAVLWKAASHDYLSGHFFASELLMDPRFRAVTALLSGMDAGGFEANKTGLLQLRAGIVETAPLQFSPGVLTMAKTLSIVGIVIEAWVAVAFLAPERSMFGRTRDVPLLLFLVGTYTVATVMGFAYLLAAMGVAQARSRVALVGYVSAFMLLQLYTIPWRIFV